MKRIVPPLQVQTKLVLRSLLMDLTDLIFHLRFTVAQPAAHSLEAAGTEGGKAQFHFEEILKSNIAIYVVCDDKHSELIPFFRGGESDAVERKGEEMSIFDS